jgi:hypothetical protein
LRQFEVEDLIEPYGQSKGPQVISSHDYFYTREMEQLEKGKKNSNIQPS